MTVYLTKAWGFGAPAGPLAFSEQGFRDNAQRQLKQGDLVVMVGTTTAPTHKDERGRLLGIVEPSTEAVMTLDFDIPYYANDYDKDGNFLWPYALLNKRAWILHERPLLKDISEQDFKGYKGVKGIVPLTDNEASKILQLRKEEILLLAPKISAQARIYGLNDARRRSSPPPSTTRRGVMHMRRSPAYTYAMEINGSSQSAFKIGWAYDYKIRMRQFNQSSMPEIGGLEYKTIFAELHDTARQAYNMEQHLLKRFNQKRHPKNHEIIYGITQNELSKEWIDFIQHNN